MTEKTEQKTRKRIYESEQLDNYSQAETLKSDILENHPNYAGQADYPWQGLDKVKIVRRPQTFPFKQRYRRHNRPADKYQVIIYGKPE